MKGLKAWLEKLKNKWQLKSIFQVVSVLCVFSLTGSTILFIRPLFFEMIGLSDGTSWPLMVAIYAVFILPMYQLLLLGYGWIFGQQTFFIQKAKRLFNKLKSVNSH